MTDPEKNPHSHKLLVTGLAVCFVFALVALIVAGLVHKRLGDYQQQQQENTGTWICENATGDQIAVINPANCGPNDLVLWCDVWETDPATGKGKCVG